ncbi:MAG: hypothetical protein IJI10_01480 [Eubacterium sp.]|nr:hypothetical protein [Eubacterium sp.]
MYYCIANPSARSGGRDTALPRLLSFFKKQGIPCRLYFTEGPGHAGRLARRIISQSRPADMSAALTCNTPPEHAGSRPAAHADNKPAAHASTPPAHTGNTEPVNLIVAGGDGTFNEVINGIDNYDNVQLAFLPVGSGNDLARGLDLPKNPSVLIRRIAAGKIRRHLDLGAVQFHTVSGIRSRKLAGVKSVTSPDVNSSITSPDVDSSVTSPDGTASSESAAGIPSAGLTHRFVISSGIGFDAAVCEEALSSSIKNVLNRFHVGKLTYGTIALRQILFAPKTACDILLDDGRSLHLDKMLFSAVMNCAYEGGGYRFAPDADPADGCMTLVAVGDIPAPKAILSFPAAHAGKYFNIKGVHHFTIQSAEIRTEKPLWVHTDGEVSYQSDHISVKCLPKRLAMLV